jgi:voltage-gated potassium channel
VKSRESPLPKVWRSSRLRHLRASLRDTWLLFREFGWPLLAFVVAMAGGGSIYFVLSRQTREPLSNLAEGIYQVLQLTFLQSSQSFPGEWYLEIFFFVMPVIGLGILAQGIADFSVLLFNRRERGKEWEMAVASTFNHHIILVGLGHLGFRVVRDLHHMEQEVVVVELNPKADLVASVKQMGVPVIQDDATRETALEAAGIRRARAILLCTQNDSMNLQVALKARRLRPDIHVVVRIFDDDFADALHDQFGFTAMSATGMAAPAFASAASGVDITRPITVEGATLSLARLKVQPGSPLNSMTVGDLELRYNISVVLLHRNHEFDLHPPADRILAGGDALGVLGGPIEISQLVQDNHP